MDFNELNRKAWNEEVRRNNFWTRIAEPEQIALAAGGRPEIRLSPHSYVPQDWIGCMKGRKVLILAGGGGQQTPIMSAFGADVTTIDISDGQLAQDAKALKRYGIKAELVRGSIDALPFPDESFDYALNPVSLCFVKDIAAVYREAYRVLRHGGELMFGIANPVIYMFDEKKQERRLRIKYTIPFSDERSKSQKELRKMEAAGDTFEYSHTLSDIIGDLISTGFVIDGFYSDKAESEPTDSFIYDSYLVFRARKS